MTDVIIAPPSEIFENHLEWAPIPGGSPNQYFNPSKSNVTSPRNQGASIASIASIAIGKRTCGREDANSTCNSIVSIAKDINTRGSAVHRCENQISNRGIRQDCREKSGTTGLWFAIRFIGFSYTAIIGHGNARQGPLRVFPPA